MKKVILTVVAVLAFTLTNAQEIGLKGNNLGAKWTGVVEGKLGSITSTIGGIDGTILVQVLNDKTICMLFFMPKDRVYDASIQRLIKGLESKFSINLKENECSGEPCYRYENNQYSFFISTDHNQFMKPTTNFTLMISDTKLKKQFDKEKQAEANTDF
jgi:hypothetical protein